nr:NUDIX domain-containing protein [Peristeroidobacter soli]
MQAFDAAEQAHTGHVENASSLERSSRVDARLLATLGGSDMIVELQERRSVRLLVVDDDGKLLLFEYHDEHQAPFWATAGGELKPGESYLDAARRELREETGIDAEIGPLLKEREAVYAVARSTPARWLEKYFLVRCGSRSLIAKHGWTDEERSTIRDWKWWSLDDMKKQGSSIFKPDWLPAILESVVHGVPPSSNPHPRRP